MKRPEDIQAPSIAPLLQVRGVSRHFHIRQGWYKKTSHTLKAVDGVDLDVQPGETLAIVGESGCGKSTLARMMVGLDMPTSGQIMMQRESVSRRKGRARLSMRKNLQMIFQDPYSSLNPRMSIASLLNEPLMLHGMGDAAWRKRRVGELLETVGLSASQQDKYPHEFSGGQRQRIGIARALAVEPKLIVCDEPVSALDVSVQAQIINLLLQLQKTLNLSLVFISHDLAVVRYLADRVAVMYLGRMVEVAAKKALFAQPRHPYTQMLLSSVPKSHPALPSVKVLAEGDLPSPLDVPTGCRYRTRCPWAQELCRQQEPELRGQNHLTACHFWEAIQQQQDRTKNTRHAPIRQPAYVKRLAAAFHADAAQETRA